MYRNIKLALVLIFQLLIVAGFCQKTNQKKEFVKGTLAYQKGAYPEAILLFRMCLNEKTTDSVAVYYALGNAYYFAQEYENAIPAYQAALDLGFDKPEDLFFLLSTVYYNQKDFKKSFDYCTKILEMQPVCMNAKVYWRMNLIYSLENELAKAAIVLKKGAKTGIKELQIYCDQRKLAWRDYTEAELKKVQ